jgi:Phospholipase A2-like domain
MSVQVSKKSRGVINKVIDALPVELHFPGFNYCGPGTKLQKRLNRGDVGVNPLDEACKQHDIVYANKSDKESREEADKRLEEEAWERVKAKDAKWGEKAAAWVTTNMIKAKRKLSGGCISCNDGCCDRDRAAGTTERKRQRKGGVIEFRNRDMLAATKSGRAKGGKTGLRKRKTQRRVAVRKADNTQFRVIPIPKRGGLLPALPAILAGLAAVGAVANTTSSIANAVKNINEARKSFTKDSDATKSVKVGKGLYLRPYKAGLGLFFTEPKATTKSKSKNLLD